MLAGLVIAARIAEFLGAVVTFGSPLFLLYAQREAPEALGHGWSRRLLIGAGLFVLFGTAGALLGQTATMAGDPAAATDPATLWEVISGSQFGLATAVRLTAALASLLAVLAWAPSRRLWCALTGLGVVVLASFAWTGHGAADDGLAGLAHLGADVLHLLAAGVWLGALAALLMLALTTDFADLAATRLLHGALAGFSGVGSGVVAILVLTGLINSWFLIGPSHLVDIASSTYGLILCAKLAAFAAMLGLAALNRFGLTPRLETASADAAAASVRADLRWSLLLETAAGGLVLGLVGALGALAPLSAQ